MPGARWGVGAVLAASLAVGCGGGGDNTGGSGDGGAHDVVVGPDTSMGGDTSMPADAGPDASRDAVADAPADAPTDGTSDAPADSPSDAPASGLASRFTLAAGASVGTSPSYVLVATLGQGPADNHTMSSPSYRIVGGLVGATQP